MRSTLLGILLLAYGFGTPAAAQPGVWVERELGTMGTWLLVRAHAPDRAAAAAAAEAAIAAVEATDRLLSTWRRDTPLARLNAAGPETGSPGDPALLRLLREVRALTDSTGGAFDPTVGALVDAWDLRGAGAVPDTARIAGAVRASGWRHFPDDGAAGRTEAAAWIDSGAFGKGAALRAARDAIVRAGADAAFVNLGGQVLAVGGTDGGAWSVPVADPQVRSATVTTLRVTDASVATTGQSERALVVGADTVGHVLDPCTGRPAPAWGSVSVVDADPLRADVLATALFVLGPTDGWTWAERHGVAALFVERRVNGSVLRATAALSGGARGEGS